MCLNTAVMQIIESSLKACLIFSKLVPEMKYTFNCNRQFPNNLIISSQQHSLTNEIASQVHQSLYLEGKIKMIQYCRNIFSPQTDKNLLQNLSICGETTGKRLFQIQLQLLNQRPVQFFMSTIIFHQCQLIYKDGLYLFVRKNIIASPCL